MIDSIEWYGHGAFGLAGTPRIMIDPWGVVKAGPAPDIILVSHEHYDHCSPADVEKLRGPHTLVIASRSAAAQLDGEIKVLRPWQVINIGRTSIKAVPAYTFDSKHPAQREDLGFVISRDYTDIYYAGDTDFIPELRNLRCDVAILPVGSRESSFTVESATAFAQQVRPRYIIPSGIPQNPSGSTKLNLQAFKRAVSEICDVVQLESGKDQGQFAGV